MKSWKSPPFSTATRPTPTPIPRQLTSQGPRAYPAHLFRVCNLASLSADDLAAVMAATWVRMSVETVQIVRALPEI